jgi:hypothetical protein
MSYTGKKEADKATQDAKDAFTRSADRAFCPTTGSLCRSDCYCYIDYRTVPVKDGYDVSRCYCTHKDHQE